MTDGTQGPANAERSGAPDGGRNAVSRDESVPNTAPDATAAASAPAGGFYADERGAKKADYWFTVLLTDPVAIPLARWLAKTRLLTPDAVTLIALLLGLAVFPLFALGERVPLAIGGIVFYLAFVTDCVDGKLARALGVTSARGAALDALADGGRRAAGSLGLVLYLWNAAPAFGLDQTGAFTERMDVLWAAIYAVLAYYFLEISGTRKEMELSGTSRSGWAARLRRYRLLPTPGMPDVQAIVFIFGPLTGLVVPALVLGSAMAAVGILLTFKRRLSTPR